METKPTVTELLESIRKSATGITLAELIALHPKVPRRTAQRWISRLIAAGHIQALGQGRARRYYTVMPPSVTGVETVFPAHIPVSPDSRDILAYIDQPLEARKPVGYQRDFLEAYEPNRTWYLPAPLRRQLRKMGETGQDHFHPTNAPGHFYCQDPPGLQGVTPRPSKWALFQLPAYRREQSCCAAQSGPRYST